MRHLSVTAFALTLGLCLSACAEDPIEPPPLASSPSASSSDATSPSPSASQSLDTPEATVPKFIDALLASEAKGDTALVSRYSTKNCQFCNTYIENMKKMYAEGGFQDSGGDPRVLSIQRTPGGVNMPNLVDLDVKIHFPASSKKLTAESELIKFPAGNSKYLYVMRLVGGSWRVSQVSEYSS